MSLVVQLNTGSTINEGRLAKGGDKLTEDYKMECAVCTISPEDFEALGRPEKVWVATKDGKRRVSVRAREDDSVPPGQVFMPRAIWANVVVDPETFSTGSPLYKGSPVIIEPSEDEVLSAVEITKMMQRRG
ncbi:MAG: molybdopterin dinucleotide binding domain-containing protein [Methanothrix sp.]|jgi:formylmethanofuran dehydrogenase subunit D|uniref:Molybdenum formylmethanofuran dehydrogenase, subunit D n=1 Tax=Methanothrix harundinacea TaxID=301375 RepID=A0A117MCJ0_9EURY|nr:MAG: formylmethanofuran dehydrogenase [Methanosaeta sp. SDB]KUK44647.1 MAG: Molybdenum formylmethanofuran dehydrogenase, subunit D [Methanothrix harundinacea]MDD2638628.1 molybdopterin dinucleotide binding domain-containing protein [Methanothrix sp.]MDI9399394.1 molybdopterin dinucleotide binding domain-containing protein [Euryarchaeota archaeon]KUK96565.1 MAG: Molybdenum formylmethanofuran dehydrogenase, subunit D [Methanothrix harundinacea]